MLLAVSRKGCQGESGNQLRWKEPAAAAERGSAAAPPGRRSSVFEPGGAQGVARSADLFRTETRARGEADAVQSKDGAKFCFTRPNDELMTFACSFS